MTDDTGSITLTAEQVNARIAAGVNAPIPKLYANGFVVANGGVDVLLVLELHGAPLVTVNLAPSMARTLAMKLAKQVEEYEAASGVTVPTVEEIEASFISKMGGKP